VAVWGGRSREDGFKPEDADYDPVKVIRGSFDVPIQFGLRGDEAQDQGHRRGSWTTAR